MAAASDSAASASDSKAASTDEWSPGEAASFLADLDEDAMKYVSADSLVTLRTAALACEHKKAVAAAKDKLDHVLFLRRWLVARQGEMDKASPMLIRHLQWREEDCPWYPGIPPTETIEEDLATGKAYIHGHDKAGQPCMYVFAGKHSVYTTTPERTQQLVIYCIELAVREVMKAGTTSALAVFDFGGDFGWSSMDIDAARYLVKMLSLNFPESVSRILIVNNGIVFSTLWAAVSPFLSARTTAKVRFLGTDPAALHEYIDPANVPAELGGEADIEADGTGYAKPASA